MEAKFLDVKQLRTDLGITQLELSKKLNTPQGYLSQVENGKRKPSKDMIEKIKLLLGNKESIDKYWISNNPQKLICNKSDLNSDTNHVMQQTAIDKLVSLLDKSQTKNETQERENQMLKNKIEQLKSESNKSMTPEEYQKVLGITSDQYFYLDIRMNGIYKDDIVLLNAVIRHSRNARTQNPYYKFFDVFDWVRMEGLLNYNHLETIDEYYKINIIDQLISGKAKEFFGIDVNTKSKLKAALKVKKNNINFDALRKLLVNI